jgi:hypothetical protein
MKQLQRGYTTTLVLVYLAILLVGGWGWVSNIVKLVGMDAIMTGMGITRIVGIFVAPLGAVMGFMS